MMRSRLAVFLGGAILFGGPVRAQEEGTVPGAIPDPSTYQGSMEMQRQSDAQDQQFREQQQQQSAQQQQQYYQQQQPYGSKGPDPRNASPARDPRARAPAPTPLAAAFQRGDYATVLRILRPKAMAGNASAQHNLGFLYEKGFGVPRNPAVAASWYQKSANQGYPAGQLALGRLYFEGHGLRRDLVEAYKWVYLAGRGSSKAFEYLRVIGAMLTYDQMSEAVQRAQLWTPVARH